MHANLADSVEGDQAELCRQDRAPAQIFSTPLSRNMILARVPGQWKEDLYVLQVAGSAPPQPIIAVWKTIIERINELESMIYIADIMVPGDVRRLQQFVQNVNDLSSVGTRARRNQNSRLDRLSKSSTRKINASLGTTASFSMRQRNPSDTDGKDESKSEISDDSSESASDSKDTPSAGKMA